jgi:DNA-binding response OmpR family regulator
VLVADEDPDIRQWLFDRLKASGYHPEASTDGREALVAVQSIGYAGVILDIGPGQVDGLNVLKKIRSQNPDIPIIIMTASGSQEWLSRRSMGTGLFAQAV